jgi:ribosomal protein S1
VGEVLKGKVSRTADFGLFVELSEGVEGLVHISELAEDSPKSLLGSFKPGQEIYVKLLGIDLQNKKISLSAKAVHEDEAHESVQEYLEGVADAGGHSLGESFPQVLRQKSKKAE